MNYFSPSVGSNSPYKNHENPQGLSNYNSNSRSRIQGEMEQNRIGDYIILTQKNSIEGYSIIMLNNVMIYEGQLMRFKKDGYGVQYNLNGNIHYQGFFRDDKYDGWGKTNNYMGQFRQGLYDGYGVYFNESFYYQGFFHRAQPSGEGISFKGQNMVKFYPTKNIYDFLNYGLKNNMNILIQYKIDQIYLGEWKQGVKHGFGRIWKQNYWYSGQFSNDVQHGLGAEQIFKQNQKKVHQTVYKLGAKK